MDFPQFWERLTRWKATMPVGVLLRNDSVAEPMMLKGNDNGELIVDVASIGAGALGAYDPAIGSAAATIVTTSATALSAAGFFTVDGREDTWFIVENGATAFSAFDVSIKVRSDQTNWQVILNTAVGPMGFSEPDGPQGPYLGVIMSSGATDTNVTTLAAGAQAYIHLRTRSIALVRLRGTVAAGTSSVVASCTAG